MKTWILPLVLLFAGGVIFLGLRRDESRSGTNPQSNVIEPEITQTDSLEEASEQQIISPTSNSDSQDIELPLIEDFDDRIRKVLVKGTYTVLDNGVISFSEDAQIRLAGGPTISSGEGFMISDYELRTFGGDLLIGSGTDPHPHKGLLTLSERTNGFSLITFKEDIEKEMIERNSNKSVDSTPVSAPR